MSFYLHYQDFVDAFVGPFSTVRAAHEHHETVVVPRGDSATMEVVTARKWRDMRDGWITCTPEEDAAWNPEA